jgi:hypothetical protein
MTKTWWFALAVLGAACGGSSEETETAQGFTAAEPTTGAEEREDGVQISGLMGTVSAEDVQLALEPKMGRFAQCFATRYGDIELLGGHFQMSFRVGHDGSVEWVFPRRSTVGDRPTERCLLDVARATRFRSPRGGDAAEFNWSLDFDPPEDVRPPFNWNADNAGDALAELGPEVMSQCSPRRGARYLVTAYVAPGGNVMAAGAAADAPEVADSLDCVSDAVTAWELPDPGSYPAKITFVLE